MYVLYCTVHIVQYMYTVRICHRTSELPRAFDLMNREITICEFNDYDNHDTIMYVCTVTYIQYGVAIGIISWLLRNNVLIWKTD